MCGKCFAPLNLVQGCSRRGTSEVKQESMHVGDGFGSFIQQWGNSHCAEKGLSPAEPGEQEMSPVRSSMLSLTLLGIFSSRGLAWSSNMQSMLGVQRNKHFSINSLFTPTTNHLGIWTSLFIPHPLVGRSCSWASAYALVLTQVRSLCVHGKAPPPNHSKSWRNSSSSFSVFFSPAAWGGRLCSLLDGQILLFLYYVGKRKSLGHVTVLAVSLFLSFVEHPVKMFHLRNV